MMSASRRVANCMSTMRLPCLRRIRSAAVARSRVCSSNSSASFFSTGLSRVNAPLSRPKLVASDARRSAYSLSTPKPLIGSLSTPFRPAARSASCAPTSFIAVRAMNSRRMSLVPSQMRKMRQSRSARS